MAVWIFTSPSVVRSGTMNIPLAMPSLPPRALAPRAITNNQISKPPLVANLHLPGRRNVSRSPSCAEAADGTDAVIGSFLGDLHPKSRRQLVTKPDGAPNIEAQTDKRDVQMYHLQNLLFRVAFPAWIDWYAIPLRLIVGFGFMQHGYAKLARGADPFINILHALGVPMPFTLGWATIIFELVCGFMVFVGLLVPIASIPMIIILFVATVTVHLPNGFSSIKLLSVDAAGAAHFGQPGYEADLLYLAGILALVIGGSGRFSLDRLLFRDWARAHDQMKTA
jgi:putative oxidoreductase